jgi:hypothetical protein
MTDQPTPTIVRLYRGADHDTLHRGMFLSTDEHTASDYGEVRCYDLEIDGMLDTLDPQAMEQYLPLLDPYDNAEIDTVADYAERLQDTWEMVENEGITDHPVVRITEGGVVNFIVYDTSRLTLVEPSPKP